MSLQLNTYVPPEHCHIRFNFENGTPLRVKTYTEGVFEGEVKVTQQSSKENPIYLELVNVVKLGPNKKRKETFQYLRLEPREIQNFEVLGPPNVLRFKRAIEKIHPTVVIDTNCKFAKLEKALMADDKPAQVGLNFYGHNVGRDGTLYYIAIFVVDDTLVVIDSLEMGAECEDFMTRLDSLLFSNENILKIVYNSRLIADYLYHNHSIYLKNVFDIQVVDLYCRSTSSGQMITPIKEIGIEKYRPLSECLVDFIGPNVIPDEELNFLKEFEHKEKHVDQSNHPLKERPILDKSACKGVALELKHLILLRDSMTNFMFKNLTDCVTTHISTHVASNLLNSSVYDMTDELAIPHGVLQKLMLNTGKDAVLKTPVVSKNQEIARKT